MTDSSRQFSWRQGNVLPSAAAVALGYANDENSNTTFVIVISHSCDLTANTEKEPEAELIIGHRIEKLGSDSYSKTARRLHIEYQAQQASIF